MPRAIFLLPGVGAQGGSAEQLGGRVHRARVGGLVTASRSVASAPDPGAAAEGLQAGLGNLRQLARFRGRSAVADFRRPASSVAPMDASDQPDATLDPTATLRQAIAASGTELHAGVPAASLERPPHPEFGDYSTNAAMLAAPLIGWPPVRLPPTSRTGVESRLGDRLERVEVAGPGFLNLHMSEAWMRTSAEYVRSQGRGFGSGVAARPISILVEFVSANPTGPLTVASGRHLAYGDSLARLLEFAGHRVSREYYLNDTSSQIDLSELRSPPGSPGEAVPEGGYERRLASWPADRRRERCGKLSAAELRERGWS